MYTCTVDGVGDVHDGGWARASNQVILDNSSCILQQCTVRRFAADNLQWRGYPDSQCPSASSTPVGLFPQLLQNYLRRCYTGVVVLDQGKCIMSTLGGGS
eukprot:scpid99351/ scgid20641/ 